MPLLLFKKFELEVVSSDGKQMYVHKINTNAHRLPLKDGV